MKRASIGLVGFTAAILLLTLPARATFHVIVIDQVFPGLEDAPAAQYVMLHTQAPVQTAVYGQPLPIFDATGDALGSFATFCTTPRQSCILPAVSPACSGGGCPIPFESNDRRILVATRWAQDLFCVTADLLATAMLPYPTGRVCWGDCDVRTDCGSGPVDCVAYGSFPADKNGVFGNPAVSPMLGQALVASPNRTNQFIGGHLLDNSMGFSIGMPAPQNFHGDLGAVDGLAGDPEGSGVIESDDIEKAALVLFETGHRCTLPAARRGADANLDTRVSAADIVATIHIVAGT